MPAVVVSLSLATSATSWSTSRKSIRWWMYSRSSTGASAEMLDLSHEGVCMKAKNVFNRASLQWFIIVMHCSGKHKHLSGKYYGCHPTRRKWIPRGGVRPELWAYFLNILCSHPLEILNNPCTQEDYAYYCGSKTSSWYPLSQAWCLLSSTLDGIQYICRKDDYVF